MTEDRHILIVNKRFAIINTTEYNEDDTASIIIANSYDECIELGWSMQEEYQISMTTQMRFISTMEVGELLESNDFQGAYIMRIA
jgi:hypothetical protein